MPGRRCHPRRTGTDLQCWTGDNFTVECMNDQIPDYAIPKTIVMGEGQVRTDISKQEAACRQIETAIGLYFCDDDEASIHVLAHVASAILTSLCRAKGIQPFRDMFISRVKPEYQKRAANKMNEAYNHFKHADRDACDILSFFNSRINGVLLLSCCYDYQNAFGKLPSSLLVFFWWFVAANPDMTLTDQLDQFPLKKLFLEAFASLGNQTELEQRRFGRELLYAHLRSQHEALPVRGLQCG